ncbi:hypothetical protein V9K67_23055 [Paraflavisolibacter sp. H34]|uniref:hypothetical protein n=1 Tax=Huijunlia imazamoxiresistens TaxID=3127457 RepID=UPI00301822D1
MKIILLFFLLLPFGSFAQQDEAEPGGFRRYGYVGGIRLDSIDALFALAEITSGSSMFFRNLDKRFAFDYGQSARSEREFRLCDSGGKALTFKTTAGALNFFDYNGWELVRLIYENKSESQGILLKKKGH